MMVGADTMDVFMQWFQSSGGFIDTKVIGITEFPGNGRGAIALCDIPEGHTLFTLPRAITLSLRTSPLPALFGIDAWRAHRLHRGWVGLILCMMWEDAWAHELDVMDRQGQNAVQTKWGPYMHTLPTSFDTPMFWNAEELMELQGTSVIDKIGRSDAERTYAEQLIPAIKTSPTLFPPSHYESWYTLDAYHRAGSRILSRSFKVSRWTDDDKVEARKGEVEESDTDELAEDLHLNSSTGASTHPHLDDTHVGSLEDTNEALDSDSDDEEDDPSNVAMVPMADLLNARWGSENAKLFHEPLVLRMASTKSIKQGEQIFNTYGDPPNSDLLRRYGHVDLVQLHCSPSVTPAGFGDIEMRDGDTDVEPISQLGNPSDVAEIRADLVVHVVRTTFGSKMKDVHTRIEWWLDEGEDDAFVLCWPEPGSQLSAILPSSLVSLTRLLLLSELDFRSARSKGKLPKGKLGIGGVKDNTAEVLGILDEVFRQHEGRYIGGSVEDDEHLLSLPETLTERKRYAVIVRLGEKRILRAVRQALRVVRAELSATDEPERGNEKNDATRDKKGGDDEKEMDRSGKRVSKGTDGDRRWKKARK